MLNPHDLERLERALNESIASNSFDEIKRVIDAERQSTKQEYLSQITWSIGDLQSLRPQWSIDKCRSVASKVSPVLRDRSTEEGWQILKDAIGFLEYDKAS
jgi:hypothetical protein